MSQWVIVTDCTDKTPIAGASVYAAQGANDVWKDNITFKNHSEPAAGGKTDENGVTYARFPKLVVTSLRATTGTSLGGTIEKSGKPNPWTTVPAGAPDQI